MFMLGLQRLIKPLAEYIEQRVDLTEPPVVVRTMLRPPGAIPEEEFLRRCYRCGNCVDVCPARAIRPVPSGDFERAGTPMIDPTLSACVVCEELACMRACPSGALQLVAAPTDIRMGLACVDTRQCVRSRGENCTFCVEKCPFGETAIGVSDGGEIIVRAGGCVGCGVCQFYCPTHPKAIQVSPLSS